MKKSLLYAVTVFILFITSFNAYAGTISKSGTLTALTTTYGTPSPSISFSVSGTVMTAGILVTPPAGFEVSLDNITFSATVTVAFLLTIPSTPVYIRLKATAAAGTYSGNVVLSSLACTSVNEATVTSTVNKAALTVTANNSNKTYGTLLTGAAGSTAFTSSALQNGETIGTVTIAYATGSAANASVAASPYVSQVTASAATGGTFTATNYTITYVAGNIIIARAALTITANNVTKVYGTTITGAAGSTAFTSSGLQNVETIGSVTIAYGTGSASTATVAGSPYNNQVTPSAATGGTFTAANYTITYATGNITVTPATLTITGLTGNNKVYNKTTAATLSGTPTLNGIIGSDVVTLSGAPTATFASANAGTGIAITVTGYTLSGASAGNYTLTQPNALTANITSAILTETGATAANKVYDGTTTATVSGGTLTGIIGSDVVTISTTGTFATSQAGAGIVVTLALTGANAANYTLTQPGITANITPLALTITGITISNKNYDGTTIATISGSASLNGILGIDTVQLSGTPTAAFVSKNVGTGISVTIAGYSLTGPQSGDYTLTQPSGFTANITAAALTIACTGPTKVTGTALTAGSSTTNFIYYGTTTGETVTSVTLTPNAAGLSASTTAGTAYTVTPSAAVGTGGFLAANYTISYVVYSGVCAGHKYVWAGTTNTTWSTTTNWTPNGTPTSTDDVSIPATTNAPTVTGSTTVNTITYTGNNTITVNSGLTLTINTGFLINSGVTNSNLTFAGTSTTTHISYSTAFLTNAGIFKVSGTGYIYITNGSYLYNSGTFTINNNATLYLTPGNGNAAAITNDGTFYAGTSGSNCNIEVDDYGSITNSGNFYLGPTSILYYYNDNAQYVTMTNEASGVFTLQSDATGTATIGEIPQGKNDTYVGTFSVQRYFQGNSTVSLGRYIGRNYRIISSCVNNGVAVSGNSVFGLNYIVGSTAGETATANSATNAFITGCSGGSTSLGNPSVYLYRESLTPKNSSFTDGNFLGITDIVNSTTGGTITASDGATYSMPVGTGVFFFFRGAASNWATRTNSPYIAPENVTLTATGKLNQGSYTYADWYTPTSPNLAYTGTGTGTNYNVRGFNMIGNPYPCSIDWCEFYTSGSNGITRTNISPSIWVFNPVTSQYDTFQATSSTGGTATGTASRYIASGQGFFVLATLANPKLVISEYAKVLWNDGNAVNTGVLPAGAQLTGTSLLMSTTPQQAVVPQTLRLKLVTDSINFDDIVIGFNSSASAAYDPNEDGRYLAGSNAPEGLASFSSDNVKLAINNLPLPNLNQEVIRLHVTAIATGTYTFQRADLQAIPQIYDIWLMDKYKKDSLDIRNNSTYRFDINRADTTSYGDNRFSLVIRQNPALAVHLLNFTATKATTGSQVVWVTENEQNYTNFTVERSINGGTTFDVLDGVPSSAQGTYSFLDKNPQNGANMYRLKIVDINGTVSYSNVITLMYGTVNSLVKTGISVYPNPAKSTLNLDIEPGFNSNNTNISLANPSGLAYNIQITSILGSSVKKASVNSQGWQTDVSSLVPGTYVIQVVNKNDNTLVGETKFIKL
jgi:phosphotransferase system IIA component